MLQKEVAVRINAEPGSKLYGKLSVMMRYYCDSEYLFDVPPGCFSPPPKVDSAVIRLVPRQQGQSDQTNTELLEQLVSAAFNQRRKTISNSLKHLVTRDTIESLGIDPAARAENLSLQQFTDLSNCINSK
jgi:16S rRNA (adenine1518-N6/adenine1519-N6)-dimethyltransferase